MARNQRVVIGPISSRKDKDSRNQYARWHYQQNKGIYKKRAREFTKKNKEVVRHHIINYLSVHPCVDCGETDPIVLEFDHSPDSSKSFNISDAANRGFSLKTIISEISKCDVRCANCHRRMTHKRREFAEMAVVVHAPV